MQLQQVCVYNQTNECFLSLGATLGGHPFARLKRMLRIGSPRVDEGCWIAPLRRVQALGIFSLRDLVYLDGNHRVVHVVESFPTFRAAPVLRDAASLLALPAHTICSSQTRPGNQLLICAPDEMESRLRAIDELAREDERTGAAPQAPKRRGATQERRRAERAPCPMPVSYFSAGGALAGQVIRDVSETGLYLITKQRWPIGAEIRMSLQRSDPGEDQSRSPVVLRMRVVRWGKDGVGLEFDGPMPDQEKLMSMHVC